MKKGNKIEERREEDKEDDKEEEVEEAKINRPQLERQTRAKDTYTPTGRTQRDRDGEPKTSDVDDVEGDEDDEEEAKRRVCGWMR